MKVLKTTMPDGSVWAVPLRVIAEAYIATYDDLSARDRMDFRAGEAADIQAELLNYAAGNMNWSDVRTKATRVEPAPPVDFQEGWVNGRKEIADMESSPAGLPVSTINFRED